MAKIYRWENKQQAKTFFYSQGFNKSNPATKTELLSLSKYSNNFPSLCKYPQNLPKKKSA